MMLDKNRLELRRELTPGEVDRVPGGDPFRKFPGKIAPGEIRIGHVGESSGPLVEFQRSRGAVVTSITEPEIAEIFEVRAMLEANAIKLSGTTDD